MWGRMLATLRREGILNTPWRARFGSTYMKYTLAMDGEMAWSSLCAPEAADRI